MSRTQLTLMSVAALFIALAATAARTVPPASATCYYFRQPVQQYMDSECLELLEPSDGNYSLGPAAQWLESGTAITTSKATTAAGELLFENVLSGAALKCSVSFQGNVNTEGRFETTKLLSLSGTEIPELDESGATGGLACTSVKSCESPEIWPVDLPFKGEVGLDEEKIFSSDLENGAKLLPAYSILCLVIGIDVMELCVAIKDTSDELSNGVTAVETLGEQQPDDTCNGTAADGLLETLVSIKLTNGSTLAVS
jgi:hypothetical protein